jgi:D-apionolactonase
MTDRARRATGLPFPRPVLWYGRDTPLPVVRSLRSGSLDFELEGVDLARVRWGPTELVNRVYMSVRDRNWDTVLPTISDLRVAERLDSVEITFDAHNEAGDIDLEWHGAITATDDGRITYGMQGRALRAFEYCRIGFCVLHSEAAAAGRAYRAETPDGPVSGILPSLIAPQEIVDGREIALIPPCSSVELKLDGVTVRTAFDGSLFSSEDQRNWTDASFKTACFDGIDYPFPARPGQTFAQRVTLTATGRAPGRTERGTRVARLEIGEAMAPTWPAIGLGMATDRARDLVAAETARLASLGLDHLRLDLHLGAADWSNALARGIRSARAVGARLELALFLDAAAIERLPRLAAAISGVPLARVIVLPEWTPSVRTTAPGQIDVVRSAFGAVLGGATLVGGTNGDFAELNRDRPSTTGWDGVSYSINPQVHAFDNGSLAETLATQASTVVTARSFTGSTPVVVSPVTLRQRFNPSAIGEPIVDDGDLPLSVDPRQMSLFGAGWTLGSIASLTAAGVASITYYETVGWRGVMESARAPGSGPLFPSLPGMVYPMFHVFADLADRAASAPVAVSARSPGALAGIGLRKGNRLRVLVANLTPARSTVMLGPFNGHSARLRLLDDTSAAVALLAPARFRRAADSVVVRDGHVRLALGPHAYVWLEGAASAPEG